MDIKLKRICIYPKDIQRITGKSEKSAQRLLTKMKKELGKEKHQFITAKEFAQYSGISIEIIQEYLYD
jgi:tRNA1(Val) A37 N6-methylase TrmN6